MSEALADELRGWLWEKALPLWATVGANPAGGFHEGIDFEGRPWFADQRLRVQARQTWVYATAQQRSPSARWRAAMQHGLDHLLGPFRRDDGLFHSIVFAGGETPADTGLLYDQAFVLLALSAVERAMPGFRDVRGHAERLMRRVGDTYRLPTAGFREASDQTPFYANPQMHLFEAMLAWEAVDAAGDWKTEADAIAEFALGRLVDPRSGALREHFDADWHPAAGIFGRIVEPGHQFEWSWLLRRWGVARGRKDAIAAANRLFGIAAKWGVDPSRGVAFNTMLDDFTPHDRKARLWPQTEWLKAATTSSHSRNAAMALRSFLRTDIAGLWQDTMLADGAFSDRFAPATSLYHVAGAIFEFDRSAD